MKTLLAFAFALIATSAAFAATIPVEYEKTPQNQRGVLWETVTNADGVAEGRWNGGCGVIEATGTQNTVDFELQWGSQTEVVQDVNSALVPDGLRFTSATGLGLAPFNLPSGFVDIKFTSAGSGGQDVDIRLIPMPCQ